MQYQIGNFSRISRLSIKTLRYYHKYGLLEPSHIEQATGYRYYDAASLERARIINEYGEMPPFPELTEIEVYGFDIQGGSH